MKFRTLLVDDELLARQRLTRLLQNYTDIIEIIAEASNGEEAVQLIEEHNPDLVFLDIEMPVYNGLEVLQKITTDPLVVFTTAYENYAIKAFENNSVDYLLKPIEKERLLVCMEKLRKQTVPKINKEKLLSDIEIVNQEVNTKPQSIPVKIGDKTILVKYEDVLYFEANDKYVELNTIHNQKHILEYSLTQLSLKLPPNFLRVHRAFLVNMNSVKEFRKGFNGAAILVMDNKEETKIHTGRTYVEAVKKWIEW
jgi:two-component system, LytTR family, response regulator